MILNVSIEFEARRARMWLRCKLRHFPSALSNEETSRDLCVVLPCIFLGTACTIAFFSFVPDLKSRTVCEQLAAYKRSCESRTLPYFRKGNHVAYIVTLQTNDRIACICF